MKTKTYLVIAILLPFWKVGMGLLAQTPGEWTWMHGDTTPYSTGVFGVQGLPSPANKPPGLYEPCEWTDKNGNFWLFGGVAFAGESAALWKYDSNPSSPTYNQWAWVKGPSAIKQPGIYGIQGVSSPANYPGSRGWGVTTWTDTSGNFWLFGGWGYDAVGGVNRLNDLWKYNIFTNEWTWMKGPNTVSNLGSYGTKGISNPANLPPSRDETSCSWTDASGNLWFYGGYNAGGGYGDLWKYDISTNEWTWMHGASTAPAVYGTQGVAAPANMPGGRWVYSSWTDLAGNLWLFGGGTGGVTWNDLWKYDPNPSSSTYNQWTWVNGPNTTNDSGNYGTKCVSANSNVPPSRMENRARVRDTCGNFWNFGGSRFGGVRFNDLWHYNVSTNQWTWVSGDNTTNQAAVYGTKGLSAPANKPVAKDGSVAWIDNKGYIWVFGGEVATGGFSNDLFRYVPDKNCVACEFPFSINNASSKQTDFIISPNPTSGKFTVQYQVSGIKNKDTSLEIYNVLGEKVFQSTIHQLTNSIIDLSSQPSGIYFLKVNTEKESFTPLDKYPTGFTQKMIIQK